nr:uncharacterized protein LOC129263387 [Lytechinus pictus]
MQATRASLWGSLLLIIGATTLQISDAQTENIRLVGGENAYEGRIEVLHDGGWGTVCDDSFTDVDAQVACRSLGLTGGVALTQAHFGQGSGQIWMDNLACEGTENALDECGHNGWGSHNCGHHEDAGVVCEAPAVYSFGVFPSSYDYSSDYSSYDYSSYDYSSYDYSSDYSSYDYSSYDYSSYDYSSYDYSSDYSSYDYSSYDYSSYDYSSYDYSSYDYSSYDYSSYDYSSYGCRSDQFQCTTVNVYQVLGYVITTTTVDMARTNTIVVITPHQTLQAISNAQKALSYLAATNVTDTWTVPITLTKRFGPTCQWYEEFECADGMCISSDQFCDGVNDCPLYGEDEWYCDFDYGSWSYYDSWSDYWPSYSYWPSEPDSGTCMNMCSCSETGDGGIDQCRSGDCYCDDICKRFGDCCLDKDYYCPVQESGLDGGLYYIEKVQELPVHVRRRRAAEGQKRRARRSVPKEVDQKEPEDERTKQSALRDAKSRCGEGKTSATSRSLISQCG